MLFSDMVTKYLHKVCSPYKHIKSTKVVLTKKKSIKCKFFERVASQTSIPKTTIKLLKQVWNATKKYLVLSRYSRYVIAGIGLQLVVVVNCLYGLPVSFGVDQGYLDVAFARGNRLNSKGAVESDFATAWVDTCILTFLAYILSYL